ncbi:MAG: flippase-like domain-containing protein [Acidobacteria bacterium]|nr:flippase-like domain-containing protein [Acidobacteriota bacterium]
MGKNSLRVGISLALMVVLLVFFLWNVNLADVAKTLEDANPWWMLAAVGIALVSYWLRAVRWGMILRPVGHARHSSLVIVTAVGYAAMTLLPARMGDIVRPLLLARRDRLVVSGTLASIVTERLFDLWSVLVFFLLFVFFPPAMTMTAKARHDLHLLSLTGYVLGAGLILGSLAALGMFRYQERFIAWITRPIGRFIPRWHQPVQHFLYHFLEGLKVLQRPRDLVETLAMSLLLWWLIFWQVKAVLLAFGLAMPLRAGYLIVTLAVIGLAIPTPGGIGGFHKGVQLGLASFFGVGLDRATGIAIAYHASCFLPITVIGLLCLPLLHISLKEATTLTAQRPVVED